MDAKEYHDVMGRLVATLALGLEDATEKLFDCPIKKKNFILGVATNLLGNLALKLSGDKLEDQLKTSGCTVEILIDWYKSAFADSNPNKEIH